MYKLIKKTILVSALSLISLTALADYKVYIDVKPVQNSAKFIDLTPPPPPEPVCVRDLAGNFVYATSFLTADFYIDGVSHLITINYNINATYEYNGFIYSIGETLQSYSSYRTICKTPI
jgi:hypothetical protein